MSLPHSSVRRAACASLVVLAVAANGAARGQASMSNSPAFEWPLPSLERVAQSFSLLDEPAQPETFVHVLTGYRWKPGVLAGCTASPLPWVVLTLDASHVQSTTAHRYEWQEGAEFTVTLSATDGTPVASKTATLALWRRGDLIFPGLGRHLEAGRYLVQSKGLVRQTRIPLEMPPVPLDLPDCPPADRPSLGNAIFYRSDSWGGKASRPSADWVITVGETLRMETTVVGRFDGVRARLLRRTASGAVEVPHPLAVRQSLPAVNVDFQTKALPAGDYIVEVAAVLDATESSGARIDSNLVAFRLVDPRSPTK